ncbi:hypothetical protein KXZ74_26030, partial [Escherichia coli]|nr:hypothetical protein [Escherichia coli]
GHTPVLARVHSECLTGGALFSLRCDCGFQLEAAIFPGIPRYLRASIPNV